MKRGADKQLTRDEFEDGDVESEESMSNSGFKKAPDEVLKTRIIRGLPNRTKPSGAQSNAFPSSNVASSGSASPFSATNTFASPTAFPLDSTNNSSNSPFKFNTPTNAFGTPSLTSSPLFNSTSQTTAPPTTSFAFPSTSVKPVSFAPSSTAKAFASVLNKSDSNTFGPEAPSTSSSSSSNPSTAAEEDDPVLFQYYINLRGLNHSLLNTISKGIEDDPFADMSGILESYKSTYLRIQKEKDDASASSKQESSFNSSTPKSSPFYTPATPSPFGTPPAVVQSSVPASDVFPTPATSFFSQSSAGVQPFGVSPSTGSKTSNETSTQSLFGAPSQKPSFFSPSDQAPSTTTTTTTSTFGSPSSPFKFGAATTSTTNQSSPSIFGSSTPASTFKWGASAEPSTGDSTGASSTITSTLTPAINNAVQFQFGNGSSGIPQLQSKTTTSADEKTVDNAVNGEGSERLTSTAEGGGESSGTSTLLATHHPHDDEGEGEENEISVHAIKVKAYRMKKADEKGGPGWGDLGFGILRLKKDKDTSARRMLLRNSTNGKILINFKIYSGLKPSLAKKALTFVGHDNGVSQTYCVRLPEEQAQQLKEVLDREIESVTSATAKDGE